MKEKKVSFVWRQLYEDRSITKIDNGLGACGELHYPSYHAKYGWKPVLVNSSVMSNLKWVKPLKLKTR
ncbi:putative beta-amylase [Helianthus annuus]|nr:putative beta-amylase [Helianthus annuus]